MSISVPVPPRARAELKSIVVSIEDIQCSILLRPTLRGNAFRLWNLHRNRVMLPEPIGSRPDLAWEPAPSPYNTGQLVELSYYSRTT